MAGQQREPVANHPGFEMARTGDRKGAAFYRAGSDREISQTKRKDGYMQVRLGQHCCRVHVLIGEQGWLGPRPADATDVDHISHDRSDNSLENLRFVTAQENGANRGIDKSGRPYRFVEALSDEAEEMGFCGDYRL
jgi:hypothetical protein